MTTVNNSNSTLIAHGDTRAQLTAAPTPAGTDSFKPVSYIELIDTLERVLNARGIDIDKEQYALSRDGFSRLFATLDLSNRSSNGDWHGAIGLRTSNNKTLANLALHGDFVALRRKHTIGLSLYSEIVTAVDRLQNHYSEFMITVARTHLLSDGEAAIYDVFATAVRLFHRVDHAYFNPPHVEFAPRSGVFTMLLPKRWLRALRLRRRSLTRAHHPCDASNGGLQICA